MRLRISLAIFFALIAVLALAVANWPPLVANSAFLRLEDLLTTLVTRAVTPDSFPPESPSKNASSRLKTGRLIALEPEELIRLWQSGGSVPPGALSILANTPASYQWRHPAYRRWLLEASSEAAVALGLDAVVDASSADALRAAPAGRRTAAMLRRAGIIRAVIFDGGHHLQALELEPDIALLPALKVKGIPYACHIHLRDAVPVPGLVSAARSAGLRTAFFVTPRLLTMAKTKNSMAALAAKALRSGGITALPAAGREASVYQKIEFPKGLAIKQSALDLLLIRAGLAF